MWHGVGDALGMAVLEDPPEEVDEEVEDVWGDRACMGD